MASSYFQDDLILDNDVIKRAVRGRPKADGATLAFNLRCAELASSIVLEFSVFEENDGAVAENVHVVAFQLF